MLKQNLQTSPHQNLILSHKPFSLGTNVTSASFLVPNISTRKSKSFQTLRRRSSIPTVKAVLATSIEVTTTVKALITVLEPVSDSQGVSHLDGTILVELVAAELDSKGTEKPPVRAYAHIIETTTEVVKYETEINIPNDFGEIGAIFVENENKVEVYLQNILLLQEEREMEFTCNSWIQPKLDYPTKRIFFANKSYLASQTPNGLRRHRQEELQHLRGNGEGERKPADRIYDYDVYNDLGDPDTDKDLGRPVLGGTKHPYPRRCRTGRSRSNTDPATESRSGNFYVPRDEAFSKVKDDSFHGKYLLSTLNALIPTVEANLMGGNIGFANFSAIDSLYNEGIRLPDIGNLGPVIHKIVDAIAKLLRFDMPAVYERDKFSWLSDAEFGRQTLAGLNPCCIKLLTDLSIKSALDPTVYGPPESLITEDVVNKEIGHICSAKEALDTKRLFVLDYHDVFLPYVSKVRELKGRTLYGSRTLFFLTDNGTLRPIVIELTRPPMNGKPQWKQIFHHTWEEEATDVWRWRLAKAHVLAHDTGFHQLVSHWLRTHCCTEPYVIAANRQLSAMHPIYRLLHPHFRYTMEINALARTSLINADGVIESTFFPGKYSIELSSVAYDLLWRFDQEALPADLINRGMAVEDPKEPYGLKLTVEDYPYANDGLLIWDAIKQWVTDYVNYYYPRQGMVESDTELQAFWTEVRMEGHGDKKDAEWWPNLKTIDDLIGILTTIIWIASGHHAAVNFGQYDFAGYFPNRPTITRKPMPNEDKSEDEERQVLEKPEEFLMEFFPSQLQATKVMVILDVLSDHSPDEEYIGKEIQPYYKVNKTINDAFEVFSKRLKDIEGIIDDRNANNKLVNRSGAGVVPYQLLKPYSKSGVTGMGIPNSVSI